MNEGFEFNESKLEKVSDNVSEIEMEYFNEDNESAVVRATFEDGEIVDVELDRMRSYFWVLFFLFLILVGAGLFYWSSKLKVEALALETVPVKKKMNYKNESKKILKRAESLFKDGKEKESYGVAALALRFFLRYKNGLGKELNNEEIVDVLEKDGYKDYRKSEKCFDLCNLVSFAKYQTNKKDFSEIVKKVREIIN
jgi:hypothetical protein